MNFESVELNDETRHEIKENKFLTPDELAERWDFSKFTLAGWRRRGVGPNFIKRGYRKILYCLADIEKFEKENPGFKM